MRQFDVLHPGLQVFGSHFLEASAGTGKTFAIEHIVCRLLIDKEDPLNIEEILVVTFTRAATREMKQRIYLNLLKVQDLLERKEKTSWPYIREVVERGDEEVRIALRRVEDALVRFDMAQIYTIHGFCYRMLEQFALEAKIGFSINDPASFDEEAMLEEHLSEFLSQGSWPGYSLSQLEMVWKRERSDKGQLLRKFKRFLDKDAPLREKAGIAEAYEAFQNKVQKISEKSDFIAGNIVEDYQKIAPCFKKMNDGYLGQVQELGKFLEAKGCSKEEFEALLHKDFFLEKLSMDNMKVKAVFPRNELHYPELFSLLRQEVYPLIHSSSDPRENLARLGEDFRKSWEEKKLENETLSHDDLLKKTRDAVKSEGFLEGVRSLYSAAIVDEFQDTDRLQWEIFEKIFLHGRMKAVYFIGDPKQSIYSFRKADLYTYLRAQDRVGIDRKGYLDTNYRSEPALVHALNTLFSKEHLGHWIRLPFQNSFLEYIPVHSRPGAVDQDFSDEKGSIHFLLAEGEAGREKSWPTQSLEEEVLFPYYAKEVLHLQAKGIAPPEIAFLVKDRYQAQRLYDFFRERGICASIKRTSNLQDSQAFDALYHFLVALSDPGNMGCLKRVLAGPFYGWAEEDFRELAESNIEVRAFFRRLSLTFAEKGLSALLEEFLCSKGKEKSISCEIIENQGVSFYQEMEQIVHILLAYEAKTGSGILQLIRFLEEKKYSESEDEEWKLRQDDEKGAVTIMTIHLSKGLEFDIVFAIGLMQRSNKTEELMVVREGENEFVQHVDLEDRAARKSLAEVEAEKMRQLYVALTRPKRRLYLPIALEKKGKVPTFGMAAPIELFLSRHLQKEAGEEELYDCIEALSAAKLTAFFETLSTKAKVSHSLLERSEAAFKEKDAAPQAEVLSYRTFCAFFTPKQVVSYTTLSSKEQQGFIGKSKEGASEEKNLETLPAGPKTGIYFHTILEKIFQRGLYHPFSDEKIGELALEVLFGSELEPWKEAITSCIKQLFTISLEEGGKVFRLTDLDPKGMQVEMEFLYPFDQKLYKGSIDLAFVFEGRYYFADWKSNLLSDDAVLEEVMKKNDYFLQASIYAEALARTLSHFEKRSFADCFGGCFYFFLRQAKVYHFYPKTLSFGKSLCKQLTT